MPVNLNPYTLSQPPVNPIRFGCRLFAYMKGPENSSKNLSKGGADQPDEFVKQCLVSGKNALQKQSEPRQKKADCENSHSWESWVDLRDSRDGWGIATYQAGQNRPSVVKSPNPAFKDPSFNKSADDLTQRQPATVLAHVRAKVNSASSLENSHPFQYGGWSFMHNGVVPKKVVRQLEEKLNQQYLPELGAHLQGETDSERVFYMLLGKLQDRHQTTDPARISSEQLQSVFADTVREVITASRKHQKGKRLGNEFARLSGLTIESSSNVRTTPACNFILSDGNRLLASTLSRKLFMGVRTLPDGRKDVVLASEKIQPEQRSKAVEWWEIPDGHLVMLQRKQDNISVSIQPMPL